MYILILFLFLLIVAVTACNYDYCIPCENIVNCTICRGNSSVLVTDDNNNQTYGLCNNITTHQGRIIEGEIPFTCLHPEERRRELLTTMETCDFGDNMYYLNIGFVLTDNLINSQFGGVFRDAEIWVTALIEETNIVFENQLNLILRASEIISESPVVDCPDQWNGHTCSEFECIYQRLDELTLWTGCIGSRYNDVGSWQIIDDIDGGGGGGVAYVGGICDNTYKTSSLGFVTGLFRTFAHELGHNLNGIHPLNPDESINSDNAGILGYGDARIDGEYAFDLDNGVRMCNKIDAKLTDNCQAFSPTTSNPTTIEDTSTTPNPTTTEDPPLPTTDSPTLNPTAEPRLPTSAEDKTKILALITFYSVGVAFTLGIWITEWFV